MRERLFVVGAGRSGTKLLMNILNNSELVHIAPEVHYFTSLLHDGLRRKLRREHPGVRYTVGEVLDFLQRDGHFGTYWRRDNGFSLPELESWFAGRTLDERGIYELIIEHDIARNAKDKTDVRIAGEKTPLNVFHLAEILDWFPRAKILFIYRDPLNVLRSEVNKDFKPDYPLARNNPLYPYGLVVFVFFEWLLAARQALRFHRSHRTQVGLISYEALTTDMEREAGRVAEFVGVPNSKRLCAVERVDSSFARGDRSRTWEPPAWVRSLYGMALEPVRRRLDRLALHHA